MRRRVCVSAATPLVNVLSSLRLPPLARGGRAASLGGEPRRVAPVHERVLRAHAHPAAQELAPDARRVAAERLGPRARGQPPVPDRAVAPPEVVHQRLELRALRIGEVSPSPPLSATISASQGVCPFCFWFFVCNSIIAETRPPWDFFSRYVPSGSTSGNRAIHLTLCEFAAALILPDFRIDGGGRFVVS